MQELNHSANPFPGLRTFESAETHLFFGRDGQSEELLKRLKRTRFLAVVGTSGSGKSSLVRAGLLPALQGGLMSSAGSDWRIAILRPGGDPIGNLARALASPTVLAPPDEKSADMQAVLAETTLRRSSLGLVELVSRARTKLDEGGEPLLRDYENLLVVVDQFEELFRFKQRIGEGHSQEDAAAFVKLLLEAVRRPEVKIYVVLTMRSDFLGDCSQFWGLPEAINDGQYLIPRMSRDERRAAITGPVAVGEGAISEPLVNQLLNDAGDSPDQLPIMQHALMRTWDYWLGHRRNGEAIDISDYDAIGGMSSALSRHADEAYEELSDAQKVIAERLFKGLTEKGADNREVRRPMEVQEICELTGADEAAVVAVVEAFRREGRSFLMPPPADALTGLPISLNRESLIDISHESLIRNWSRLKEWTEEEALSARIYRRLAETAVLHKAGEEALLKDPALQVTLDWREKNRPNAVWGQRYHQEFDPAMSFLDASVAARAAAALEAETRRRRDIRRTRVVAAVFFLLFMLSLAASAFAYKKSAEARAALRQVEEANRQANDERARALNERDRANEQTKVATLNGEKARAAEGKALEKKEEAEKLKADAERQAELARVSEAQANAARGDADAQRQRVAKEAEKNGRLLYFADINLAQQEYEASNFERASELLSAHESEVRPEPRFEWYYLWHLLHSEKETLKAPDNTGLNSLVTSPDGKMLAIGTGNKVELRRAAAGETEHRDISLPDDFSIGSLAFSPDGKVLAVGEAQGEKTVVKFYDTALGNDLGSIKQDPGTGDVDDANSIAFSPDGKELIVGGGGGTVKRWDVQDLKSPRKLGQISLEGTINLAVSPDDGKTLALGSRNSETNTFPVVLWDISTNEKVAELSGHGAEVTAVAFTPDGKTLATGSLDRTVRLWDPVKRQPKSVMGFASEVFSLAYSNTGRFLAIGFEDGTIRLCDMMSSKCSEYTTLKGHHETVTSLSFSAADKLLYSCDNEFNRDSGDELSFNAGSPNTTIKSWDVGALIREQTPVHTGSEGAIIGVAYSPDGGTLATAMKGKTPAVMIDAETNKELRPLSKSPSGYGRSSSSLVAFSLPDGKLIAIADGYAVKLWNPSTGDYVGELKHEGRVSSMAFSSDGTLLAVGTSDGGVKIWDAASQKPRAELPGKGKGVTADETDRIAALAFSPDGKSLIFNRNNVPNPNYVVNHYDVVEYKSVIGWWDWASTKKTQELEVYRTVIDRADVDATAEAAAFSPDGNVLAVGYSDGDAVLYDIATGRKPAVLLCQKEAASYLVFSPDGRLLLTGGDDGTLKLWDTASSRELLTLRGHSVRITDAAFSPDRKKLATLDIERNLRVWNAPADAVEMQARREGP